MKRRIALIISLVLLLTMTQTAWAEQSVRPFCDAAVELAFDTSNVTLNGHADFLLDGKRFKTANLRYVQDDVNSLLQLDTVTPRRFSPGPDWQFGYTVVANGEYVYVMEVFYPGVYKTGTTPEQDTVLRKSVQMELMTDLFRILADQADTLPGKDAVSVQSRDDGGQDLRIELDENVPDLVNTALTLIYQYAAKRYFETDYDRVSEWMMSRIEDYLTITEGILGATKSLSLKQASVTASLDSAGDLEGIRGELALSLHTAVDGVRELSVDFDLAVSDRGESHVGKFDPSEYGVQLADGYSLYPELP